MCVCVCAVNGQHESDRKFSSLVHHLRVFVCVSVYANVWTASPSHHALLITKLIRSCQAFTSTNTHTHSRSDHMVQCWSNKQMNPPPWCHFLNAHLLTSADLAHFVYIRYRSFFINCIHLFFTLHEIIPRKIPFDGNESFWAAGELITLMMAQFR